MGKLEGRIVRSQKMTRPRWSDSRLWACGNRESSAEKVLYQSCNTLDVVFEHGVSLRCLLDLPPGGGAAMVSNLRWLDTFPQRHVVQGSPVPLVQTAKSSHQVSGNPNRSRWAFACESLRPRRRHRSDRPRKSISSAQSRESEGTGVKHSAEQQNDHVSSCVSGHKSHYKTAFLFASYRRARR